MGRAKNTIIFVEPLLLRLKNIIKQGQKDCLNKALTDFGTEDDIRTLSEYVVKTYIKDNNLILIDFTPFVRLGNPIRMSFLQVLYEEIPFLVVAMKGIAFEHLRALSNISTIVCDEGGQIINITLSGKWEKHIEKALGKLKLSKGDNLYKAHKFWVENFFLDLIPRSVRKPPDGIRYLPLHDGAWANLWIDVKKIIGNPDMAFFVAYQMGYILSNGFVEDLVEDGFIVSNNTALILAVFLNSIFDRKELVIIDRLGPYPNLSELRFMEFGRFEGKQLCMIEDVVSTAKELDMTQLIVYLNKAEICRAVCLFDLEIASARLIQKSNVLSLCKPSTKIRYKRMPMYTHSENVNWP